MHDYRLLQVGMTLLISLATCDKKLLDNKNVAKNINDLNEIKFIVYITPCNTNSKINQ